jgi:hypothetical protein
MKYMWLSIVTCGRLVNVVMNFRVDWLSSYISFSCSMDLEVGLKSNTLSYSGRYINLITR